MMSEHDCGCLPVVDDGVVVGMVTDRDIALALAETDEMPSQMRVSRIMTEDVYSVRPDTAIVDAEAIMRTHQIRRLPVVDSERAPVGLLSLNDIARAGVTYNWQSDEGLSAHSVASTLAAVCQPSTF